MESCTDPLWERAESCSLETDRDEADSVGSMQLRWQVPQVGQWCERVFHLEGLIPGGNELKTDELGCSY